MFGSDQTLNLIIRAKDEASAVIDKFKGGVEKMKPQFESMAKWGTVAFAGISAEIYKSVEAAGEAAKVQAQLGAVLKSTGGIAGVTADKAIELSKALQKQTTYGDEAILSAENMLLTFTNIGKDIFPDVTKVVLDMSTALGQDLKSSSIQVGKALQDPILGVSALRRVGVNFTESQQEMIKKLVETGHTLEAQKFILKELNTEFGGSSAAAAETFAGKLTQMKEKLGDVQESIGGALIPVITKLLETLVPVVDRMTTWIEKNPELTKNILLGSAALAGLVALVGTLGVILPAIITGVGALSSAFVFFAATPLGATIAALTALAAIVVGIINRFYELKTLTATMTTQIAAQRDMQANVSAKIATMTDPAKKAKLMQANIASQNATNEAERFNNSSFLQKVFFQSAGSFETGGTVQGPVGRPVPIIAHGGETISPAGSKNGNGDTTLVFNFNGAVAGDDGIKQIIKQAIGVLNRQTTLKTIGGV